MSDRNKIKDNCFALPKGINWCPMDVALKTLEENLNTVCQKKKISSITSLHKVKARAPALLSGDSGRVGAGR